MTSSSPLDTGTAYSPRLNGLLLPSLFPDLQWLRVALTCETLYLADHIPYSRKSRVHRGKIRTPTGTQWIHIPIELQHKSTSLAQLNLNHHTDWLSPLWRALEFNYRNSIYFDLFEHDVHELFEELVETKLFIDGTRLVIERCVKWLEIPLPTMVHLSTLPDWATCMGQSGEHPEQILTEYDSRNYLPPLPGSVYPGTQIDSYRQHFSGFEPNCCWLDLLFECGPESWHVTDSLKIDFKS